MPTRSCRSAFSGSRREMRLANLSEVKGVSLTELVGAVTGDFAAWGIGSDPFPSQGKIDNYSVVHLENCSFKLILSTMFCATVGILPRGRPFRPSECAPHFLSRVLSRSVEVD